MSDLERKRERLMETEAPDLPFGGHPSDQPERNRAWGLLVAGILLALAIPLFYAAFGLAGAIVASGSTAAIIAFVSLSVLIVAVGSAYAYARLRRAQLSSEGLLRDDVGNTIRTDTSRERGAVSTNVGMVMKANPIVCGYLDSLYDVAKTMYYGNVGFLGVLDEHDRCIGVVTDRDVVCGGLAEDLDPKATPVTEIMEKDFKFVRPNHSLGECLRLMQTEGIRRVPVLDGNNLVGVIALDDLIVRKLCTLDDVGTVLKRQFSEPGLEQGLHVDSDLRAA